MLNNLIACNLVTENMSAFIDRELDEDFDYEIKKHLSICLDCRRKFSKMLKIHHLMKKYFKNHLNNENLLCNKKNLFSIEVISKLKIFSSSSC